jgi:hypothetical protein
MTQRPEQDAFRQNDRANENLQAEETSLAFLEEIQKSDKTTVAKAGDSQITVGDSQVGKASDHAEAAMAALNRAAKLASSLPTEMLTSWIDNNSAHFERALLAGIDPRNKDQRDEIMNVLSRALKSA